MILTYLSGWLSKLVSTNKNRELETLTKQVIEKQKERLFNMYLRGLLTKESLIFYLNKLDEPILK